MADISKITLPSGNTYDIKDATARSLIAGGITFSVAWDGNSTPVVANIPAGVVVTYSATDYVGTKTASSADLGTFYLVKTGTGTNKYDEYVVANSAWEKLGTQEVDLSGLGDLAYKDSASVSFTAHTTDKCLGSDATFTTSVTPSTSKLATTTVPNVTNAGSASTWAFAMGTGDDAETLIISGGNSTAPTLGTAKTVATGSLDANGGGASVATGISSATTQTNSKDEVTAITALGTGTAS